MGRENLQDRKTTQMRPSYIVHSLSHSPRQFFAPPPLWLISRGLLVDVHRTGVDVYPAGYVGVHDLVLRVSDRHGHLGHHEPHDRRHAGEVQGGQLGREPPPQAGKGEGGLARLMC